MKPRIETPDRINNPGVGSTIAIGNEPLIAG
jgi:hypothetical protein